MILGYALLSKEEAFSISIDHDLSLPDFNFQENMSSIKDKLHRRVESMIPFKPYVRKYLRKFRTGK